MSIPKTLSSDNTFQYKMDPEIDVDAANNAAAEGRGEGLDWATSLTFDTGE
jgi:hypothetical protein